MKAEEVSNKNRVKKSWWTIGKLRFIVLCLNLFHNLKMLGVHSKEIKVGNSLLFSSFQPPKTPLQKSMDILGKQLSFYSLCIIGECVPLEFFMIMLKD